MTYKFTRDQLLKLLRDTIKLERENIHQHGYSPEKAFCNTPFDMLEGLDADRKLHEMMDEPLKLQEESK